jgi:hypothetical protein
VSVYVAWSVSMAFSALPDNTLQRTRLERRAAERRRWRQPYMSAPGRLLTLASALPYTQNHDKSYVRHAEPPDLQTQKTRHLTRARLVPRLFCLPAPRLSPNLSPLSGTRAHYAAPRSPVAHPGPRRMTRHRCCVAGRGSTRSRPRP